MQSKVFRSSFCLTASILQLLCLVFFLTLFISLPKSWAKGKTQVSINFAEVESLINKNQWPKLMALMATYLEKNPQSAEAQMNLALSFFKMGKSKHAAEILESLAKKKPFYFPVYFNLGPVYHAQKNLSQARKFLELGHRIRPKDFDTAFLLAQIYEEQDEFLLAQKLYNKMLSKIFALKEVPKRAALHYAYSEFLKRSKKFSLAEEQMWHALELTPKSLFLQYQYAILLEVSGVRQENQMQQLQLVLDLDENHAEARLKLAYIFMSPNFNLTFYLSKLAKLQIGLPTQDSTSLTVASSGDQLAKNNFMFLINKFPLYQAAYLGLARYYIKHKDYQNALTELKSAMDLGTNVEVLEELAQVQMAQEKFDEAAVTYGQISQISPHYENAYIFRSKLFERLGMVNESIKEYMRGIEQNPKSLELYLNLGHLQFIHNQCAEAMDTYERALSLDPTNERAHLRISKCALKANDLSHSQKHLYYLNALIHRRESSTTPIRAPSAIEKQIEQMHFENFNHMSQVQDE